MKNKLPSAVFPSSLSLRPSNPVTMTDAYNHSVNTPMIDGTRGGQREGAFASVRSVQSLGFVQRGAAVNIGGVLAYQSTMLVKGRA